MTDSEAKEAYPNPLVEKESGDENGVRSLHEDHNTVSQEECTAVNEEPASSSRMSLRDGAERTKRVPVWMKNYIYEGLKLVTKEDGEDAIAMFIASEDPDSFEDAVKHKKWQEGIKAEIKSIEKITRESWWNYQKELK